MRIGPLFCGQLVHDSFEALTGGGHAFRKRLLFAFKRINAILQPMILTAQLVAKRNDLLDFLFETGKRGIHGYEVCWKNGFPSSSSRRY